MPILSFKGQKQTTMFFYRIKNLLLGYILNLISYMGDFMAEVVKIVLTGGPCGGKTSALKYISEELKSLMFLQLQSVRLQADCLVRAKPPKMSALMNFTENCLKFSLLRRMKNANCQKYGLRKGGFAF